MSFALLAINHKTSIRLAEIGFLFILIAGVWLVASEVPALRLQKARTIVAGVALALAGLLLIIATHWGNSADSRRFGGLHVAEKPAASQRLCISRRAWPCIAMVPRLCALK